MIISAVASIFAASTDIFFWLKWITSRVLIWLYRATHPRRFDLYDFDAINDPLKLAFVYPKTEKEVESPCPESHLEAGADEVFFYGVNSNREYLIVRISRGAEGEAEAWLYLKLKDGRTYHLAETSGYEQSHGDKTFSCGGLQMYYLAPMRKWRIFYSGMLIETSDNPEHEERKIFVKFAFIWKATSEIFDVSTDMNPSTVAKSMSRTNWAMPFLPPVNLVAETLDIYCQGGTLHGLITVEDQADYETYLFGEKMRYLGKNSNMAGAKFKQLLGNSSEIGRTLHLGEITVPNMFKNLEFGFVVEPDGSIAAIRESHIITKLYSPEMPENNLSAKFSSGKSYQLKGKLVGEPIKFRSQKGWKGFMEIQYVEFSIENYKGSGVLFTGEITKQAINKIQKLPPQLPEIIPLTVKFSDEMSQFTEISGGKGASLGKLTKLSIKDKSFIVPKGIIVTTSAYSSFLTQEIIKEIKVLEDIVYGNVDGDIETACSKVSTAVVKATLTHEICKDIEKNLEFLFNQKVNEMKFAVRSSATGEDTDQMSAAGQMDTFLGIQGLPEIFKAVKKCWASQFGHIAVEYKRRNGQVLNTPMAVVIQEMVHCEVAGVLFTCDPVTNNPSVIAITANYGLGESVVSGSEEPDTIILQREEMGEVSLKSVLVGAKQRKIVMKDDGGVITEEVATYDRENCCLSEEMAENLGKIAIKIEKHYRSPRDIEWGIRNNKVYMLQSRPVTSGSNESEFEIVHEFDAPIRCELEYFTKCNIGEGMPGAMSPLGIDTLQKFFTSSLAKNAKLKGQVNTLSKNPYFISGVVSFYNHMMLSAADLISCLDSHDSIVGKATMIGFFGRTLHEEDVFVVAKARASEGARKTLFAHYRIIRDLFFGMSSYCKVKKHLERVNFPVEKFKSSREVFSAIMEKCSENDDGFIQHTTCTQASITWNMFLLMQLGKNKETFDTDIYSDFARLLAKCSNVLSADVPAAMQDLAYFIVQDIKKEDFKNMSPQDATNWLLTSSTVSGKKFQEFLQTYGHRCLKEFDVHSVPWKLHPQSLVKLLQNLSGALEERVAKSDLDYKNIFSELKTPLDFKTRCLMRFMLPHCHRAVGERESCKSLLIMSMDNWRKGYLTLSKFMVSEGRIPDKDLIFFLTIDEIQELIETRSPKIISRAVRRRKLFPTLEKYVFPEMMKGFPKPINDDDDFGDDIDSKAELTMKGIPVSQGVVKAYARVALTLEEAAHLKQGEILITYSTDIGWSPYFPILSGVVTELGGLISHGAVISREYGLPCVVGLQRATKKFQTGDYVLLDGNRGILQRLPKPETQ